jgi:CDP-glucose 4,6-dehydratase
VADRQSPLEGMVSAVGRLPRREAFAGRRVLVTGHTGFKGAWLTIWLRALGAEVVGIGLPPATTPSLFELARVADGVDSKIADMRNPDGVLGIVDGFKPEFVFHLAAHALVRASYGDPVSTFDTNIMGTVHLLDALRKLGRPCVVVAVTSDKVYRNAEWSFPYRENDELGGRDPYSASKAAAELVVSSFRDSFLHEAGFAVATARAGNVIGGGDWSPDRLMPDAIRAWGAGRALQVRRPSALRPWQHVLDALNGYLVLAEALSVDRSLAEAWNFGPSTHRVATVGEVVEMGRKAYGTGDVVLANADTGPHEAGRLMVEPSKARERLGVTARWDLEESITRTMDWYRRQSQGSAARDLCLSDLAVFGKAHD